jgi:hypothetical protein
MHAELADSCTGQTIFACSNVFSALKPRMMSRAAHYAFKWLLYETGCMVLIMWVY